MIQQLLGGLIGPVFDTIGNLAGEYIEDKDKRNEFMAQLATLRMTMDTKKFVSQMESQTKVLVAEITGESWLQRNWRPLLMTMFGVIIANNYILVPYIRLIEPTWAIELTIPPDMWGLLKLGLSGYIIGRSVEKVAGGEGLKAVGRKILGGSQ